MKKTTSFFNKYLTLVLLTLMYCKASIAMENRADLEFTALLNVLRGFIAARNQPAINNILRKSPMINWNNMLIDPTTGNNIFHIAAETLPLVWVYGNSEHQFGIEKLKNKAGKTLDDILVQKYKQHYAKKH